MSIKSGSSNIKRHARNYTGKQAQARLTEVIGAAQQQAKNALMVDSFEIKYYQQAKSTTVCTCKQTSIASSIAARIIEPSSNVPVTLIKDKSVVSNAIRIDYNRPLFGTPSEEKKADDFDTDDNNPNSDDDDEFDLDFDDDDEDGPSNNSNTHTEMRTVDATFTSGRDCGICYKTGFVPGYVAYGFERALLTTHNISDVYGFTTDMTTAPHTLRAVDHREGYVEFEIDVPLYFHDVNVSVRLNTQVLQETLYSSNGTRTVLTFAEVKAAAGKTLRVRVHAEEFTHAVVEFDLGTEKLRANLAQMSKTVDWTLFDTLGSISMILPPTIQNIAGNDVIFVPSRAATFKVTDVTYLRTADEKNLDWPITTRILQPQESLGRIHRSMKLPQ